MDITFTNTLGYKNLEQPIPATKMLPDWYKEIESYVGGKKIADNSGLATPTIKKCMPVFDAIVAGYLITLPADVVVYIKDGVQSFDCATFNLVASHNIEQAPNHPERNEHAYPKWINPWAIKTPPGYSCLFVQPFHRESEFTILPGIVDTDTYTTTVNFPMVINNPKFEGIIPKGTPIAQVIPFKRDTWEIKFGGFEEMQEQAEVLTTLKTKFFDRYKNMFRASKEYK
jgi:hypothetical protein